jgi:hypothetical protein
VLSQFVEMSGDLNRPRMEPMAKKKQGRCPASKILGNPKRRLFFIPRGGRPFGSRVALPRLGPLRLGPIRLGPIRLPPIRLGRVRPGLIKDRPVCPRCFATNWTGQSFLIDVGALVIRLALKKSACVRPFKAGGNSCLLRRLAACVLGAIANDPRIHAPLPLLPADFA